MSNMSYCRFENTLADLKDCASNFDDEPESTSEKMARARLLRLCMKIAENYGDDADYIETQARAARDDERAKRNAQP